MFIEIYKSWINRTQKRNVIKNKLRKAMLIKKQFLRMKFINDWIAHWTIYQNQFTFSPSVQIKNLKKSKIKQHVELTKIKSNVITQMRIEKIELAKFLHISKILGFNYQTAFTKRVNKCQNMWWWIAPWCRKGTKYGEQWVTLWTIIVI